MDYTVTDGVVAGEPVKIVDIGGVQFNLLVERLESRAVANGPHTDLSIPVRVVRLDDTGKRLDEGPVTMQTISGASPLQLQTEVDNLVQRVIDNYIRALSMQQVAVGLPVNLVGASVALTALEAVAVPVKQGVT